MALIELESIIKTYTTGSVTFNALDNVSLSIANGEFVAIMGTSGSGKSTLMNILGCLDRPTSGIFKFDDIDVSRFSDDQLAFIRNRKMGFVYQNFNLLPQFTALENAMMPLLYAGVPQKERYERALKSLKAVGLADRVEHRPTQLSGGQQQRVAIARALVKEPAILFGDELTGNVDEATKVEIMTIVRNLNERGVTIVVVTHDNEIAEWASRTIYVKNGRLGGI